MEPGLFTQLYWRVESADVIATVIGRNWGFRCKFQIYVCIYESSQALACVNVAMTVFQMAL